MTDYIAINDTQLDPDAPLTSSLAYQFRNNPIAINEGSTGAPKISGAAFGDQFHLGMKNAADATYATYDMDLSRVKVIKVDIVVGTLDRISLSDDGGSTWNTDQVLSNGSGDFSDVADRFIYIDLETGDIQTADDGRVISSAFTPLPDCNAVRFRADGVITPETLLDVYAVKGMA